jgi:hypothetical protein
MVSAERRSRTTTVATCFQSVSIKFRELAGMWFTQGMDERTNTTSSPIACFAPEFQDPPLNDVDRAAFAAADCDLPRLDDLSDINFEFPQLRMAMPSVPRQRLPVICTPFASVIACELSVKVLRAHCSNERSGPVSVGRRIVK